MTDPSASSTFDPLKGPRADLARAIPRRPRVSWWLGLVFAIAFAALVTPAITAERIYHGLGGGHVGEGQRAKQTVRVPPFAGIETAIGHIGGGGGGGVLVARGDVATADDAQRVIAVSNAIPHGPVPFVAYALLAAVLAGLFAHHMRRSNYGRLVRVQAASLGLIVVLAVGVKIAMLGSAVSVLVVPVALLAIVPTLALDRVVGLATGTLAALVVSLLVPFDVGIAILLLVQAAAAGLVVPERPKNKWRAALAGGIAATVLTALTYPLLVYLTTGRLPTAELADPLHSAWIACALGPAIATFAAVPLAAGYQLLVGEISHGKLVELEDLSHPLLKQIAERAPGTWQHSLMMANLAEIAANEIGANGRLVRVGAYFHDLGKSLQPKYFIENLGPGETSPHDQLPPKASCDAIFAHVTEGIVTARRAGLHERIVDFMHMHHGNGVLEYFWAKCQQGGNADGYTIEHFRYPGVPPQSRETAILAICDAVEAASRTLKKVDAASIDALVQRIVYGKLHLGQLDDSGLSMGDLRRVSDSLRETIRHANHNRIEYPWQKEAAAAEASVPHVTTSPRLDSLDRKPVVTPIAKAEAAPASQEEHADTSGPMTPKLRVGRPSESQTGIEATAPSTPPAKSRSAQHVAARDDSASGVQAWQAGAESSPVEPPPLPDASLSEIVLLTTPASADPSPSHTQLEGGAGRAPAPRASRSLEPEPPPKSPEAAEFADEARGVLREASKELIAIPREIDSEPAPAATITGPAAMPARKRAATLPPIARSRPPTLQPIISGRRAPTIPPAAMLGADPKTTLPGPLMTKSPARVLEALSTVPSDAAITIPPPTTRALVVDQAREHEMNTRVTAERPAVNEPEWRAGMSARIDAMIDDGFGSDTPVKGPSRAELRALLDQPPEITKQQSLEELERLHYHAANVTDPEIAIRPFPSVTNEVDDADIEAAIELAPKARRTAIGVMKKKTPE